MRNPCCVRFKKVSTPLAVFCPASALIRFVSFSARPSSHSCFCPKRGPPGAPVFRSNHVSGRSHSNRQRTSKTLFSSLHSILAQSRRPPQILSTTQFRFETVSPMWSGAGSQYPIIRHAWMRVQSRLPENCCQHLLMGQVVSLNLLCNFLGPHQTVNSELHRDRYLSKLAVECLCRNLPLLGLFVPTSSGLCQKPPRQVVVARSQLAELANCEASALSCEGTQPR